MRKVFDDLSAIVKERAVLLGKLINYHEAELIASKLRAEHADHVSDEHIDDYISKNLSSKDYVKTNVMYSLMLMKDCAELGFPKPDYPIQLHYMDGKFTACYEPNYESVIESEETDTPEAALESLIIKLKERTKS